MSMEHEERVTCRKCGEESDFVVWQSLNTMYNPEAKEKLITGELFRHQCPKCGTIANVVYDLLYHDMENQTMIQLAADRDIPLRQYIDVFNSFTEQEIAPGLPKMGDDYRLRIVRTQNELREKIYIFDQGLDDRVIELIKSVMRHQLSKSKPDHYIEEMLLAISDKPERFYIRFTNGEVGTTEFPQIAYNEMLNDLFSSGDDGKKEYFVDYSWAEYFMNNLKPR